MAPPARSQRSPSPSQPSGKGEVSDLKSQLRQGFEKNRLNLPDISISEQPIPSLLRGYSALIRLESDLSNSDLFFLLAHDSDEFNRWEAGHVLARKLMLSLVADFQQNKPLILNPKFVDGLRSIIGNSSLVHCVWAAVEAYSAPSIVSTSYTQEGLHVFDDFREAYAWLWHNTEGDDKVASWWDNGYQTTAMANRTVIVDNNTWNNTHIATVGTAMSSPEKAAWEIFNSLDVKYVLVVFGGLFGYPSDDINKFPWMVCIGGGVFPHIKEPDYLTSCNIKFSVLGL